MEPEFVTTSSDGLCDGIYSELNKLGQLAAGRPVGSHGLFEFTIFSSAFICTVKD